MTPISRAGVAVTPQERRGLGPPPAAGAPESAQPRREGGGRGGAGGATSERLRQRIGEACIGVSVDQYTATHRCRKSRVGVYSFLRDGELVPLGVAGARARSDLFGASRARRRARRPRGGLRDPARARPRQRGHGLPRPRPDAGRAGRDQGAQRRSRPGRNRPPPLRAGGPRGRVARGAPQRGGGPALRTPPRPDALPGHAVREGPHHGGAPQGGGTAVGGAGTPGPAGGRVGAGRGPRERLPAPGRPSGQRALGRGARPRAAHRLRYRGRAGDRPAGDAARLTRTGQLLGEIHATSAPSSSTTRSSRSWPTSTSSACWATSS